MGGRGGCHVTNVTNSQKIVVALQEMYEQRRREVNKVADKFEKQMKIAKKSGSKANQDKVCTS